MGRITGVKPAAQHTIIERMQHALDVNPGRLARTLDVKWSDLDELHRTPPHLINWDDEIWTKIRAELGDKLGMLLAVIADIDAKRERFQGQRATRLVKAWKRRPKY